MLWWEYVPFLSLDLEGGWKRDCWSILTLFTYLEEKKILKNTVSRLKMKRKVLIALLLKVNENRMRSKRKIVYTPMKYNAFLLLSLLWWCNEATLEEVVLRAIINSKYKTFFKSKLNWPRAICTANVALFSGALAREARSGAPWVRKCGKLPIQENLVITWPYTAQETVRPHHRHTNVK